MNEKLSDTQGLTQLGSGAVGRPERKLEAFPFRHAGRDTKVTFFCEEFTCLCPLTGQPDFATLEISYIPEGRALESKSLKNYLWSFRDSRGFHEDIVNVILDDLHDFLHPKWIRVTGHFKIRGGIAIDVEAERAAPSA
ncbi:MAG: 7-cyano-7-deazaguanine reductase [Candidatus Sumerlaeota bacterium]|nr:7-cyano-7-deazaguanine reductase [Candidatus Sumerlaeota bacterium]